MAHGRLLVTTPDFVVDGWDALPGLFHTAAPLDRLGTADALVLLGQRLPANVLPASANTFVEGQLANQPLALVLCNRLLRFQKGYTWEELVADFWAVPLPKVHAEMKVNTHDPRNLKTIHALVTMALQRLRASTASNPVEGTLALSLFQALTLLAADGAPLAQLFRERGQELAGPLQQLVLDTNARDLAIKQLRDLGLVDFAADGFRVTCHGLVQRAGRDVASKGLH